VKRRSTSARLHGATSQNVVIFIFAVVHTSMRFMFCARHVAEVRPLAVSRFRPAGHIHRFLSSFAPKGYNTGKYI
jgi:hypothetical protein